MVTVADARAIAATLPRSYEAVVRDRLKFRVGSLVYVAFSRDETMASGSAPPQAVNEQQLADGWVLSFKTPGILPYHATVYRNIDAGSYRCVITTEEAAQMADGIAVCKSLRP